ncbi:hypothetical protein chiPu_0010162 [Chiloscyllium punctatum]|uniref:Uncharacterized protein n=1 Tax=Chiloscyllium punctatum TaxID=137246 RepID=A0A401SMV4_CHIPU|nr:hypothetical protein [Chiloscyllium punctatum]
MANGFTKPLATLYKGSQLAFIHSGVFYLQTLLWIICSVCGEDQPFSVEITGIGKRPVAISTNLTMTVNLSKLYIYVSRKSLHFTKSADNPDPNR